MFLWGWFLEIYFVTLNRPCFLFSLYDLRSFVENWAQEKWATSPSLCRQALSKGRISLIQLAWGFNSFQTFSGLVSSLCVCFPLTPQYTCLLLNLLISLSFTPAFSQVFKALLYSSAYSILPPGTHGSAVPCSFYVSFCLPLLSAASNLIIKIMPLFLSEIQVRRNRN